MKINFTAPSDFEVFLEPPSITKDPVKYSLSKNDFAAPSISAKGRDVAKIPSAPYLIIGFDTEFQTSAQNYTHREMIDGKVKNTILSYQFHAIYSENISSSWQGIACPSEEVIDDRIIEKRLSLGEFISFAIAEGVRQGCIDKCPLRIYLVGHFTRADIPAFSDFQDMRFFLSNLRNTFSSTDIYMPVKITFPEEDGSSEITLAVMLRDTMLLTPATSKSLSSIGELLGKPKIILDSDPEKEQFYKENMRKLRDENWELFKKYAITDAEICAAYAQTLIEENEILTGITKMPTTLTSIGVELLWQHWKKNSETIPLQVLGKETVSEQIFDKKRGYYIKKNREIYKELVHLHVPLATECYHGGRNEQYWFGPGYAGEWHDYDLSSAYPTAMSLIGLPDWDNPIITNDIQKYQAKTFGFVMANFIFPDDIRYPTIPVRTDNGLIFPRSGSGFFCAPELALARSLGAEITIKHGVIFPTDETIRPFGDFVRDCIQKRKAQSKGSLKELFWKEITNSTYGKTAQGLMEKRVYDMRERDEKNVMKALPPSRITNPFYAAMITSMVRAVLGEIMNNIPKHRMVFSCTTDGFLTDASESDISSAQGGALCRIFSDSRYKISGDSKILEEKHKVAQPLGWRTRGQATLKPFTPAIGEKSPGLLLAKGGIRAPRSHDTDELQNKFITRLFFDRCPDSLVVYEYFSSVRDIVVYDVDLVGLTITKRLSMEFDWKRRPSNVGYSREYSHLAFATKPWETVAEFQQIREFWQEFTKTSPVCLKNIEDYQMFFQYVLSLSSLSASERKYLRKRDGAISRLRQSLTRARRHGYAGLSKTNTDLEFAALLESCGIPCSVKAVENARPKNPFIPNNVPATPEVLECLKSLKNHICGLIIEDFLPRESHEPLLPSYDPSKRDDNNDFLRRLN